MYKPDYIITQKKQEKETDTLSGFFDNHYKVLIYKMIGKDLWIYTPNALEECSSHYLHFAEVEDSPDFDDIVLSSSNGVINEEPVLKINGEPLSIKWHMSVGGVLMNMIRMDRLVSDSVCGRFGKNISDFEITYDFQLELKHKDTKIVWFADIPDFDGHNIIRDESIFTALEYMRIDHRCGKLYLVIDIQYPLICDYMEIPLTLDETTLHWYLSL